MSWSTSRTGKPDEVVKGFAQDLQDQNPEETRYLRQHSHFHSLVEAATDLANRVPEGLELSLTGSGHMDADGTGSGYLQFGIGRPVELESQGEADEEEADPLGPESQEEEYEDFEQEAVQAE